MTIKYQAMRKRERLSRKRIRKAIRIWRAVMEIQQKTVAKMVADQMEFMDSYWRP